MPLKKRRIGVRSDGGILKKGLGGTLTWSPRGRDMHWRPLLRRSAPRGRRWQESVQEGVQSQTGAPQGSSGVCVAERSSIHLLSLQGSSGQARGVPGYLHPQAQKPLEWGSGGPLAPRARPAWPRASPVRARAGVSSSPAGAPPAATPSLLPFLPRFTLRRPSPNSPVPGAVPRRVPSSWRQKEGHVSGADLGGTLMSSAPHSSRMVKHEIGGALLLPSRAGPKPKGRLSRKGGGCLQAWGGEADKYAPQLWLHDCNPLQILQLGVSTPSCARALQTGITPGSAPRTVYGVGD